jgi:hypothetical protein
VQVFIIKERLIKTSRSATHHNGEAEVGSGRRVRVAISGVLLATVPPVGLAATFTFTPVDVPFAGVTETDANGVNNSAQIVGVLL